MNGFELRIKNTGPDGRAPCLRPAFAWRAPAGYDQFTVQVASDAQFQRLLFLRDTRERYIEFDSAPLNRDRTYYVRVRSGLGEWSTANFMTEK